MSIDHIVLGLISLNPCSGYDMKLEFEQGGAGMLSALSFGSIYPHLKQLEQDGLIVTVPANENSRRKKVYELTAQGWQELSNWLELTPAYPIPMRDDLLLKMLFWGAAGEDRETLAAHLHARRTESNDLLNYIRDWQSNGKSFVDEYTELVLTYIQSRLEAELSWIEKTIEQLKEEPRSPVQDPRWLSVLQKARRNRALTRDEPAE
ncbi:MAG: PadR family transcriptional regulator [Ktedonobacteraceae bacterium]|nr:PadR family transcriptional regulator [Ktedonobacteraceae bacterium]